MGKLDVCADVRAAGNQRNDVVEAAAQRVGVRCRGVNRFEAQLTDPPVADEDFDVSELLDLSAELLSPTPLPDLLTVFHRGRLPVLDRFERL